MSIYNRNQNQIAMYWAPSVDDKYGARTFSSPVEIRCRWQDKQENFIDAEGKEKTSSSIVYPDRELENEGWLYLGQSSELDPHDVDGAKEIKATGSSPNLRNSQTLIKIWL